MQAAGSVRSSKPNQFPKWSTIFRPTMQEDINNSYMDEQVNIQQIQIMENIQLDIKSTQAKGGGTCL